jgi:Zn-dependent protease
MKQSIRLGRVAGAPVGAHWSLAVIFALVTWELADSALPGVYGGGTRPVYWVAAVVATLLFLASLLAHESSHAVVARHYGIGVRSITLWLFGGVAELEGEARTPGSDFAIAVVGPAMSLALAGLFAGGQLVLERAGVHGLPVDVSSWLWQINLLLAAFNLVPAAPLDGGRILRSGLWKHSGNRSRAAVVAARAGRGFGVLLIGIGVVEFATGSPIGLWPALLGWFLFVAAGAEESATRQRDGVAGQSVGAVMMPQPPVAPEAMTVAELLAGPINWWYGRQAAAVVGRTGWIAGTVTVERIRHVPGPAQATTTLGAIAEPLEVTPVGRPDEPMAALLNRMYAAGGRPAVVLDAENRLAGIVTLDDVARAAGRSPRATAPAWGPGAWGQAGRP